MKEEKERKRKNRKVKHRTKQIIKLDSVILKSLKRCGYQKYVKIGS